MSAYLTIENKDIVSLHAYLTIENRPVTTTKLRYSKQELNKREVTANDDTGIIKFTLWGSLIDSVPEDGVYIIKNTTLREWPQATLCLTTSTRATIQTSTESIAPSGTTLTELVSFEIHFPP